MKKSGKIIASIFASLGIIVSIVIFVVAMGGQAAQEAPADEVSKAIAEGLQESTSQMSDSERQQVEQVTEVIKGWTENTDFEQMKNQGILGAILSVVILVTVLINVPSMPFITPGIATVAALAGVIFCGIGIMIVMVPALIGSVLVLIPSLKNSSATT